MALKYLKSINTGSISSGSSVTKTWTLDEDIHLHRIYLSDRLYHSLANTQVWIELGAGNIVTKDYAPASIFGNSPLNALLIDKDFSKGSVFTVKVTNNEGEAINVDIVFEVTG